MQVAKWYITLDMEHTENWEDAEKRLQGLEDILQVAAETLGIEISDFEQK